MAKFDFNNSRYAKFFDSKNNRDFLQTFINTEGVLYTNYQWYKTQGAKDTAATPTPTDGAATFTQKCRALKAAPLMDLRAPLGDSLQGDKEGISFYTASIPDFIAEGTVEQALERDYKIKTYEQFGNDADIVAAWTAMLQEKIDSVDATMNFMTASLISTGMIDYRGIARGLQAPLHKANIPEDNFVTAGEYIWTDKENCKILTQMATIEKNFRDKWGYGGALVWQMPKDMYYNTFLNNSEVKELVKNFRTLNYIASTETMITTEMMFRAAFVDYQGVSPIEVVIERERNKTNTGDSFINGWNKDVAVLRPAGKCCTFKYTNILDRDLFEKYGSTAISKVFATANDGLSLVANTTLNNGNYKEWHTDVMMSAVPALNEFYYHVIVDTATADS